MKDQALIYINLGLLIVLIGGILAGGTLITDGHYIIGGVLILISALSWSVVRTNCDLLKRSAVEKMPVASLPDTKEPKT